MGWFPVRHPWDFGDNFIFLYSMNPLEFYEKNGIYLDVSYQLCCRSVNNGEWMPLDQKINNSVWNNRKQDNTYGWYILSDEDLFLHLITRSVFDKKKFTDGYIEQIQNLFKKINHFNR